MHLSIIEEIISGMEKEAVQGHFLVRLFSVQCKTWGFSTLFHIFNGDLNLFLLLKKTFYFIPYPPTF